MVKIEVEEWHPTRTKEPDPNCKHCHGTGIWLDKDGKPAKPKMCCICIIDFSSGKTVKKMVDFDVKMTEDGGAIISMGKC